MNAVLNDTARERTLSTAPPLSPAAAATSGPAATAAVAVADVAARRGLRNWRAPPSLLALLLPVSLLLAAEAGVRYGLIASNMLPAPSAIIGTIIDLGHQGLAAHIVASNLRVGAGYAFGAAAALLLGAAVGLSRRTEAILDPTFQALRAIPSLAWVPLLLLWLGIDEAPKLVL